MNLGKEDEITEFKESTAEFDRACKAIVAILNKSGAGTVYFGVKDSGDVIGQQIGKDTLSTLTDRLKDSIKPSIYPIVKKETYDNKDIIRVSFSGHSKPYSYKGAFYIRVEQQDLIVDPLVLRELIKEGNEFNEKWENELTEYDARYIDEETLDRFYRQSVAMGRLNKFEHTSEELLTQLRLMVNGKLTNAGFYLFGKNCPLVLKCVEYPSIERLDPIDLKRFEGNIFNLIDLAINFINQKMRWRTEISDVQRKEIPEVPIIAVREIIINSLTHCDYISDSEHQITIDPKSIEIYNPGIFGEYTPEDYVNEVIPSRTKHKVIQGIVFKAYDIETLGRGLKRMDKSCRDAGVDWTYKKYPFGFSFIFKRANSHEQNVKQLTLLDKKILTYMKKNNGILENIATACSVLNKKERTASNILKKLVDDKIIKRVGPNKTGYWEIVDKE